MMPRLPSAPVFAAAGGISANDGANLIGHQIGREIFDPLDAARVLHGDQRDHGLPIDAELMKGLEIGLDSRSAARVRSGNRQRNRLS